MGLWRRKQSQHVHVHIHKSGVANCMYKFLYVCFYLMGWPPSSLPCWIRSFLRASLKFSNSFVLLPSFSVVSDKIPSISWDKDHRHTVFSISCDNVTFFVRLDWPGGQGLDFNLLIIWIGHFTALVVIFLIRKDGPDWWFPNLTVPEEIFKNTEFTGLYSQHVEKTLEVESK